MHYYYAINISKWYLKSYTILGLPLLGNIFDIDVKAPCSQLVRWSQEYDGIYTINMMGKYSIVLSGLNTIRVSVNYV